MRGDQPLVEKFSCTLTPFGTQIFIPGYWSFDGARDIDWKQVAKAHKARGIERQGPKAAINRISKEAQLNALLKANEEAERLGMKGKTKFAFLKKAAGLSPATEKSSVYRLLNEARARVATEC